MVLLFIQNPDDYEKQLPKTENKLKTWLHIVGRTKTIQKDAVCIDECKQYAIYGKLFDAHPLDPSKSETTTIRDTGKDENDNNNVASDDSLKPRRVPMRLLMIFMRTTKTM